jgi:hypothetical protein
MGAGSGLGAPEAGALTFRHYGAAGQTFASTREPGRSAQGLSGSLSNCRRSLPVVGIPNAALQKGCTAGRFVTVTLCVRLGGTAGSSRQIGPAPAIGAGVRPDRLVGNRSGCGGLRSRSGQTMATPRPSRWPEHRARHPQLVFSWTDRFRAVLVPSFPRRSL